MYHLRKNNVISYSLKEVLAMINTEVSMDILALHRRGYGWPYPVINRTSSADHFS
jgi:hypothetical protein